MDLQTTYMGLKLKNPLVASASPLTEEVDNIKRMEDAGAAAVVLFSLFEEQVRRETAVADDLTRLGTDSFPEALNFFPEMSDLLIGPERYLDILRRAVESVEIPVIASLNGCSTEGWLDYARYMQEAGAQALELNLYFIPADFTVSGQELEQRYLQVVAAIKKVVTIPVAVKLSPYFSATGHMAQQFDAAGADALVLFNRFYQPDFNIEGLQVVSNLQLSSAQEIRLPLLWIAMLYGRVQASLAATTGVEDAAEVVKYILAGADVVMTTSALLRHGIDYLGHLLDGLGNWMERKQFSSISQWRGSMSQRQVPDPAAFERANYIKMLKTYRVH